MALGKALITTDTHGSSREIIKHGKSCYIIEKDVKELTRIITDLLENKYLRDEFGEKGGKLFK